MYLDITYNDIIARDISYVKVLGKVGWVRSNSAPMHNPWEDLNLATPIGRMRFFCNLAWIIVYLVCGGIKGDPTTKQNSLGLDEKEILGI